MAASPDFLDYIADQLAGFGPTAMRRMFSGAGLFRGGLMFGLVARDVLYFKVGEADRGRYLDAGAKPFAYQRHGATATLTSFYEVPAGVLDDADALAEWARAAFAAAQATAKPRGPGKSPTRRRRRGRRKGTAR